MRGTVSTLAVLGLLAAVAVGVAAGVGGYTFVYAKGASYMQDDPSACANCHVMNEQLDAWQRSSHHAVAVCNDCHTPKPFFAKYLHKARNGWHHSTAFTSGVFHEPISIGPVNRQVTEERCRSCHAPITESIDAIDAHAPLAGEAISCIRCHRNVGHLH